MKSIFELTPKELKSKFASAPIKQEKVRVHWHPGSNFVLTESDVNDGSAASH